MYSMRRIYLIGIGPGNGFGMTQEAIKTLKECPCIIGAARMLETVKEVLKDIQNLHTQDSRTHDFPVLYDCYKPEQMRDWLEAHSEFESAAVVLSGDVGFYSGAKRIREVLKTYEVYAVPGISSVVYLAARLGEPWEDAELVSVHGREQNFIQTLAYHPRVFLLLGGKDCGRKVWERLHAYRFSKLTFYIGKNLSYGDEEIFERTMENLHPEDLDGLCTVFIKNEACEKNRLSSIPDEEWIRGKVPMTKEEVRTVSISKLGLAKDSVLYDIGAGTGTVAVEAALKSEQIRVYAVEKNPEGIGLIRQNKQKFFADGVQVVEGTAPECLEGLEPPTHVFIGGSSGNLKEILRCVKKKNPAVKVVINVVSLETLQEATEAAGEGLLQDPEFVQISVSKAKPLGSYHLMMGQNPVYIISERLC